MEKHDCRPFPDRFSIKFYCLQCGKRFIDIDQHVEEIKEVYIKLYNLILDDINPLLTTESVVLYINERLKEL